MLIRSSGPSGIHLQTLVRMTILTRDHSGNNRAMSGRPCHARPGMIGFVRLAESARSVPSWNRTTRIPNRSTQLRRCEIAITVGQSDNQGDLNGAQKKSKGERCLRCRLTIPRHWQSFRIRRMVPHKRSRAVGETRPRDVQANPLPRVPSRRRTRRSRSGNTCDAQLRPLRSATIPMVLGWSPLSSPCCFGNVQDQSNRHRIGKIRSQLLTHQNEKLKQSDESINASQGLEAESVH